MIDYAKDLSVLRGLIDHVRLDQIVGVMRDVSKVDVNHWEDYISAHWMLCWWVF